MAVWFPVLSGIIFLAAAFIMYSEARKSAIGSYSDRLENNILFTGKLIDTEISRIFFLTDSVKNFLETSDAITSENFENFTKALAIKNPHTSGSVWTYMTENVAIEGHKNNSSFKRGNRFFKIVFMAKAINENCTDTTPAINENPENTRLMNKAAESGEMVSGDIISIGNNKKEPAGIINIFIPVYKKKYEIGTESGLKGILHTELKPCDILKSAGIYRDQTGLDISLHSYNEIGINSVDSQSLEKSVNKNIKKSAEIRNNILQDEYIHEVCFAGRKFKFTITPSRGCPDTFSNKTKTMLFMAFILLAGLFLVNMKTVISNAKKDEESEYRKTVEVIRTKSLLQSIINAIPQNICWKDSDLNYLGCNSAFAESIGIVSSEDIVMIENSKISIFDHGLKNEINEKNIIMTGIPELNTMIEITSEEGQSRWICMSKIPLASEDGLTSGILCIYDDMTSILKSEMELSVTRKLLEAAFEQNPAGMIMITSDDMALKLINKAALLFFGVNDDPPEKYLGKKYPDEINPTWKEAGNIKNFPLARTIKGEKITNEEYRIVRKNGDNVWGIINGTPVYDKNGTITAGLVIFTDITERKNMEDALKINEEKYRALFEQSNAGVFLYNHDFVIFECNEQFAVTIGSPREKLIGLELTKLKDQKVMPAIKKALTGEIVSFEGDYDTTTSGISIRVSFVAIPIKDSKDEIICGCAVVENITEKWLIQKALMEKSEELDKFFTNSLDLLCIAGTDSIFRRLNPQWEIALGYSVSELTGRSFWDFVHPDDIRSTKSGLAPLNSSMAVVDFENRYRCLDGTYKWIEWRAFHSGDTIYAAARDITSRKKAEEEIRSREELFRTLSEMAPIGIFLANEMGEMILANRKWLEISGITIEESTGNGWIKLVHPEDVVKINEIWSKAIDNKEGAETECRFIRPDGKIKNILIKGTPIIKNRIELTGFVGIIEDITERKRIETEREHLLAELSHKNSELEGIVYAASHDLRSPLVNIQGFSMRIEKLTDELASSIRNGGDFEKSIAILEKKIPAASNYIKISAAKMDALIKGLLQVARIGRRPLVIEKTDMNMVIGNILQSMAFQIHEAGAEVVCGNLPECMADVAQLNQVFSNLIDNAVKYASHERKLVINISGYMEQEKSVYIVEDTGCGISNDHKEKIWGLFYRVSPAANVSGEGLGLTMVKKIIDRHGGKIWMESDSSGTKFFIELKT